MKIERELKPIYDSRLSFYGKAKEDEEEDGEISLFSYGQKVAKITKDNKVLLLVGDLKGEKQVKLWCYSQTSFRHTKEFLRQHCFKADNKNQMLKDYEEINESEDLSN